MPPAYELGLQHTWNAGDALLTVAHALSSNLSVLEQEDSFAEVFPGHTREWWDEISNLCHTAGDALELVVCSLTETAGMLASSNEAEPTAPMIGAFIIEASVQYLVSTGHNLTNIALRLCIESPECLALLSQGTKGMRSAINAATTGKGASGWLFQAQASAYAEALADSPGSAAQCMRLSAALHDTAEWREVTVARNRYFHRWREGLRGGSREDHQSALRLHEAARRAASRIGDAIPDFYRRMSESFPPSVDANGATGPPLLSPIRNVDVVTGEETVLLPDEPFSPSDPLRGSSSTLRTN